MKKFLIFAMAALTIVACDKKEEQQQSTDPTAVSSVTLDKQMANVLVGETLQLTATLAPAGVEATVTWSSSNTNVATVADGLVTAVAKGEAIIVAAAGDKQASCVISVIEEEIVQNDFSALLTGSNYYVFALDATTYETIKDKVVDDFRINGAYEDDIIPDDVTCVLEIWNPSEELTDANWPETSGPNCFGEVESWIALNAASCSWNNMCGGLRQAHRTVDLSGVTGDYTLAIVYKTPATNTDKSKATFTLYSTNKTGAKPATEVQPAQTNGEWTLLEISMADMFNKGLDWTEEWNSSVKDDFYTLGIVIEPANQGLEIDAVLVYKK